MQKQIHKMIFVSEMIASDRLYEIISIMKGILAIISQYVNKYF